MTNAKIVPKESIDRAKAALEKNGFVVHVTENGEAAKKLALSLIPAGSEVMTMTSVTADKIGLSAAVNESPEYRTVRALFSDTGVSADEKRRHGAAPAYAIGSVHAVTETGSLIIASATGSQLPAYAYGAGKVIFVVGAQKIVPTLETGLKRVSEYVLPLESDRARKAYGVPGSAVNKMLLMHSEVEGGRVTVILVKEALGF